LHDLGEYPGLVRGEGTVAGELYEVRDSRAFGLLDEFEGYDPCDVDGSFYVRRAVRLREPEIDAWVYVYNRSVKGAPLIREGDWRRYVAKRNAARSRRFGS
jgi:gamma-glutamylcyclotransferase (GGCT)/AIG2-like uncharacterized protein YtfP